MKISLYLIVGLVVGLFFPALFDNCAGLIRQVALVVILMRVGLALDFAALRKSGRAALLLSFLPASFEIVGMVIIAPLIFGVSLAEAALLGCIVAAVSPAVVVPRMLRLSELYNGRGGARVAQVVMAAGSFDDLFVILLFSGAMALAQGSGFDSSLLVGLLSSLFFGLFVSIAILRRNERVAATSKKVLNWLWLIFEPLLFISVAAQVDLRYAVGVGAIVVAALAFVMVWRMVGAYAATSGGGFTARERVFCMIAYTPKATVQAAIGALPLAAGLACGELALSMAVTAILITAPFGALAIDISAPKLLEN
ncbi:MAG: cation:proton antiporter [Rikenellaceae bacterium]